MRHSDEAPLPPTYTDSQLSKYLHSFSFNYGELFRHGFAIDYNELKTIQQHHLSTYPFENLSLHYSTTHTISLDLDLLFEKFVEADRGRGGYCMENNAFLGSMLRSMGYDVTSVGARVCDGIHGGDGETFGSWSHMVNIITISNKRYMVDVAFGGNGATAPLPLEENTIHERIAPSEMRLIRSSIKQHTDPHQRLWLYQARETRDSEWQTQYCFTETEFLAEDYEMMNFWTSQSRTSIFTQAILMAKMVMEDGKVVGAVTMFNEKVKREVGGVVVERFCMSEEDRLGILKEWFGVRLTGEEERGIKGLVTELKG
ncbi:MAG: hypothetical protein L6R42_000966 [Xanthoria sp. 1 TBL-2021]|nr:MAG: hypothetical protein L6R42_000966 [Xanthoria sp. 1 TBL-2021]